MSKYEVEINSVPSEKMAFMKALRVAANLELRQASSLAAVLENSKDVVFATGIEQTVAEHIATLLRDAGATVTVRESAFKYPMLCFPDAHKKYKLGAIFGISEDKE